MAKPKIGAVRTAELSALSAFMPQKNEQAAAEPSNHTSAPVGRPRTLPSDTRSVTFRVSEDVHHALKKLAVEEKTSARDIILAGLADQFARRGLSVKVK